jgi:cytochrome c oxidase cbb3-type subunit 3
LFRALIAFLACALPLAAQADSKPEIPKQNPHTSEADVANGKRLFLGQCAPCHGPSGDGGRGANLARPVLSRAPDDPALFTVLKEGIQRTEMPGAYAMTDREIWQVAAFVRTLGRTAVEKLPGDPAEGERLYRTKGNCSQCHTVKSAGGRMGPPLTEIGGRRSAAYLRQALLEPETNLPEDFLQVQVATKDGRRITGIRLNEDTYSIQVRDLADNLHSFWKKDLTELRKERNRSPMPSYRGVFSETELNHVVAYLASLRGEK